MMEYFGLTAEEWGLLLGGVQAVAVIVGVPYGLYQLRELRAGRSRASVEKMLEEWREDAAPRDHVLEVFPVTAGASTSERAAALVPWMEGVQSGTDGSLTVADVNELMRDARLVVERINDLGSFVELGIVEERHFYAQFHYAIVRLAYLLEPYVVLRTALRDGNRWGMRFRRLRVGAERYHWSSPLHRSRPIRVRGGAVAVEARHKKSIRVPFRRSYIPRSRSFREEDDEVVAATQELLRELASDIDVTLEEIDHWYGPI